MLVRAGNRQARSHLRCRLAMDSLLKGLERPLAPLMGKSNNGARTDEGTVYEPGPAPDG